jgi:hypothetical protein
MGHLKSQPVEGGVPVNDLRGEDVDDSRKVARFLAERCVRIVYAGKELDAWLVECSALGIGLVTPVEMKVGETIVLKLATGHHSSVNYRVRHCTKLWYRAHQVGAVRDPNDDADGVTLLKTLLAPELPQQCS